MASEPNDLLEVTTTLQNIAGTCAGPGGKLKALVLGPDPLSCPEVVLTSCSRRLMEHSRLLSTSPTAQGRRESEGWFARRACVLAWF